MNNELTALLTKVFSVIGAFDWHGLFLGIACCAAFLGFVAFTATMFYVLVMLPELVERKMADAKKSKNGRKVVKGGKAAKDKAKRRTASSSSKRRIVSAVAAITAAIAILSPCESLATIDCAHPNPFYDKSCSHYNHANPSLLGGIFDTVGGVIEGGVEIIESLFKPAVVPCRRPGCRHNHCVPPGVTEHVYTVTPSVQTTTVTATASNGGSATATVTTDTTLVRYDGAHRMVWVDGYIQYYTPRGSSCQRTRYIEGHWEYR